MRLRSFQGLVPVPQHAAAVAAVPYDVVNREESYALAHDKPLNLLHVDRAEIDLPLSVDPYSAEVYAKAKENLDKLVADSVLVREAAPSLYLYRQTMGDHSQTGLVGVCHTEDYAQDVIKKHEKTRPDKEDDRTRLVDALSGNTGPIFLTYRGQPAIDAIIQGHMQAQPADHDFTAPDGVRHQSWRLPAEACAQLEQLFASQVPASYIADGHHRAASAFRVSQMRRQRNPEHTGAEDYNWFLCVLFPGNELNILPYNRAVKDLNGRSSEAFLAEVSSIFTVTETAIKTPTLPGHASMYLGGKWYDLAWQAAADASPIDLLDVSILQDRLLQPVLGIDDPRTSKRIDFIGGIRGTAELEKLVNAGDHAVAFSMFPVTVDQLMAISDAEQIMPPKSTWFEPKLRSGLFIHTF
ncbi:MAG: DUF1015 family protein [Verrucomicrobia bacterium]|nr:DUF1015 family protein [Verrucomicrobiota bacterium]